MPDPVTPEERDHLAAELALGVLDGEERARALRLVLQDAGFARDVERWGYRLAPLLAVIPGEAAPAHVWRSVEARIAEPARPVSRERFWRFSALGAGALAASLALLLFTRAPTPIAPAPTAAPQVAVSQLARADGKDVLPVRYDAATGTLHLGRSALATGGKSPELWVIPADGVPRSLGMLPAQGRLAVRDALRPFFKDGAVLAVSLEDASTAPHEAPSATPILTGTITTI